MRSSLQNISLTNNFVVIHKDENETGPDAQIQLRHDGPIIRLENYMTLADLESRLRMEGEMTHKADFFAPDGSRYARSSQIRDVLKLPYFKLKLDNRMEFHCHSKKAFAESIGR